MTRRKSEGPSTTGVSMWDVYACLEDACNVLPEGDAWFQIERNGLGGMYLRCIVTYRVGGRSHESETREPWTPEKGRLEAFLYRSAIDTLKAADAHVARLKAGHTGGV